MPSFYAHYRFGSQILPTLPADIRRPIHRYRSLFDMGLQGPDFFFYHNYLTRTPVVELGSEIHNQTGLAFFTRCCDLLRRSPSEAGLAYLHGVLAHYCLDSACHPFIYEHTAAGSVSHTALEVDFDRHLLTLDGCQKPYAHKGNIPLKLRRDAYDIIAVFYPATDAKQIRRCIRSMAFANGMLSASSRAGRGIVQTFLNLSGGEIRDMVMPKAPNPACAHLIEPMLQLYDDALERFPVLLEQLRMHMTYNAPLGELFTASFNH